MDLCHEERAIAEPHGHATFDDRALACHELRGNSRCIEHFRSIGRVPIRDPEDLVDHFHLDVCLRHGSIRIIDADQLNRRVEAFPSNLVASTFGFTRAEYFELSDPGAAAPPVVST